MRYLYILLLVINVEILLGQCGLQQTFLLADLPNEQADTTNVSILVNGATNNNLATAAQGLCGVKLKFKHPFMKELFIELISPAGQKITLTGGNIVATNTQLITWDVTFVPCSGAAAPDPGFTDYWENDQLWQNLSIYTGQYYPYNGCLDSFNVGTVNGAWTLRCIDFEDEGAGKLLDAELIFCQDQGIFCGECHLVPGDITNPDIIACEGDQSLKLDLNKTFPGNVYNETVYNYSNIVFGDSTILAYQNVPDLTSYLPGTYLVCGTQAAKLQNSVFPAVGSKYNRNTLEEHLFELGACASVSSECMQVEIKNNSAPVNVSAYICKGDKYVVDGRSYEFAGDYNIIIENGACDSLVKLQLNVLDISALIKADRDSISCDGNTVGMEVIYNGSPVGDLKYQWFTTDGILSGDKSFFVIDAVKEGTYFVELTATTPQVTCKDTLAQIIYPDRTFPEVTFDVDTITCAKDTVEIMVDISRNTQSITWTSKNGSPFLQGSTGIRVWQPDMYYITVVGDNSCTITDSIMVFEDKVFQTPQFAIDTLTCLKDSADITAILDPTRTFDLSWLNSTPPFQTTPKITVQAAGKYQLMLTDRVNGCTGVFDAEVTENKIIPFIIGVVTDTIDCVTTSVTPVLTADQPIASYRWVGQSLNSSSPTPQIIFGGTYLVTITSALTGCTNSAVFEVVKDTLLPDIVILADSISCLKDSVQLILTSNIALSTVSWTGPFGFASTVFSPFVKREGVYTVDVTAENGCKSKAQISVYKSKDIPEIFLFSDSLKCGRDTLNLRLAGHKSHYSYVWTGPGLLDNNVPNPRVVASGSYVVTVTDTITGCTDEEEVSIADDRIYTTPDISVEELDCAKDSVQIMLKNTDIVSVVYTGPSFTSSVQSPFVSRIGTYYFTIINQKNCITNDSITVINNDQIPILMQESEPIKCGQDSILIKGLSSLNGTNYTWQGPSGFSRSGSDIYAYIGGSYILKGTAPNGCESEITFEIGYDTISPVFAINPFDTLTCRDSVITISTDFNPDLGEIKWLPADIAAPTINITRPGTYTAIATSKNNCTKSITFEVLEDKTFPTFDIVSTSINCKDSVAQIVVNPTSAYKDILWKNASNPMVVNDGVLDFKTTFAGIYDFTITNDEGCQVASRIEVIADTIKPQIVSITVDTISCTNTSTNIMIVSNDSKSTFLWNGPEIKDSLTNTGSLKIFKGGVYNVVITGQNYCNESVDVSVYQDSDLPIFTTLTDTLTCDDGKVNIAVIPVTADLSYLWSGPNQFSSNLRNPKVFDPGIYTVTVTATNGCAVTKELIVTEDIRKPSLIIPDTILLPCDSSSITLTVQSDQDITKYNWLFPDGTLHTIANPVTDVQGIYKIQIAGENGCPSINKSFVIGVNTVPPGFSFQTDTITCKEPLATLKAQSPVSDASYEWISPSGIIYTLGEISTDEAGIYKLVVTDKNKCKDSITVMVGLDTLRPFVDIQRSGAIQCASKLVILDASSSSQGIGFSGNWTTVGGNILQESNDYKVEVNKSGSYTFSIINNQNGCSRDTVIQVSDEPQQFTEMDINTVPPLCPEIKNGTLSIGDLNGQAPYTVQVNGEDKGQQFYFNNLWSGNYSVTITDSLGCMLTKSVVVPPATGLMIDIPLVISLYFGDSLLLKPILSNDPSGLAVLRWYDGDSLLCEGCTELWVRPFLNNYYTVVYEIDGFCSKKIDVLIKVTNDIDKAIPNIFMPSSTVGNGLFYIPQVRGIERVNSLHIFDRWAENVYKAYNIQSGDSSLGWDGYFDGKACQPGIYVVIAELLLSDGTIWKYKGDVMLVR